MIIKSYKSALISLFIVILVSAVIGILYHTYMRTSEATLTLSSEIIESIGDVIIQRTIGILEDAEDHLQVSTEVAAHLHNPHNIIAQQEQWLSIFWKQLRLNPQLNSIYIADSRGNFVQARSQPRFATRVINRAIEPPAEQWIYRDESFSPLAHINKAVAFDPTQRLWFQNSIRHPQPIWSEVYRFHTTDELGITVSMPYRDAQGNVWAILGIDISLQGLSQFLSEQYFGAYDVAVIVNSKNQLIAYPLRLELTQKQNEALLYSLDDISAQMWLKTAWQDYHQQDKQRLIESKQTLDEKAEQRFVVKYQGDKYVAAVIDFPPQFRKDWKLLIAAPESDLLSGVNRSLEETLVVSVIILFLFTFILYIGTTQFFEPVRRLARNTRLINELRLDEVEPVKSSFEEIREMDASLNQVKEDLQTFEKYAPSEVVKHFIQQGHEININGEYRELSFFNAGIDCFSEFCEQASANDIIEPLSHYLDRFSEVIYQQQGTLDKYVGDTLLAFWGAPLAIPNSPIHACHAALQCRQIEHQLQRQWRREGRPLLRFPISLHSGRAIVGHLGTSRRLQYTAIGDQVEFTEQLRTLNAIYGVDIIVSERIYQRAKDVFHMRLLDCIKSERHPESINIYVLLAEKDSVLSAELAQLNRAYEQAFTDYQAQHWDKAIDRLQTLQQDYPTDKASTLLLHRCQKFKQHGVNLPNQDEEEWDGAVMIDALGGD